MSIVTRHWRINEEALRDLRIPRGDAPLFLRSIGVDPARPFESTSSPYDQSTNITQRVYVEDMGHPLPLEREILNSVLPDEDMWFYEPELARCRGGFLRVAEVPNFSFAEKDNSAEVKVKDLKIEELRLVKRFELVSLLIAVDEDSLEVYWCRKTP